MLIVLFFILLMLFHIYSILIITLSIAYFLALNIQKPSFPLVAKNIFKSFSFVFLITAPLIWLVYSGEHISSETLWSHTLIFQWIPNPLVDLTGFLKGVFCNIIGNRYLYLLFPGLLISLVLPHNERGKQFWFFFLLIMMPVLLLLILDLKIGYWFIQRQFIWVMPLFAVLLGWCWESSLAHIFKLKESVSSAA